jgi:hypothetical protein
METNNGIFISITGCVNKAVEAQQLADGQKYARFEITPPDEMNGAAAVSCIAFKTRAELLERFISRGELLKISGFIGPVDYLTSTGEHIKESNMITVTAIEFLDQQSLADQASA